MSCIAEKVTKMWKVDLTIQAGQRLRDFFGETTEWKSSYVQESENQATNLSEQ